MRIGRFRIGLSKMFIFIYLLNEVIIAKKWYFIPGVSFALLLATLAVVLIENIRYLNYVFCSRGFVLCLISFFIVNYLLSSVTSIDHTVANNSLTQYLRFLILLVCIVIVSVRGESLDYLGRILIVLSLIIMALLFTQPVVSVSSSDYTKYLTYSESTSPHTVGVYLMMGIWSVLYLLPTIKKNFLSMLLIFIFLVACLFAIYLTNSRKSIVGSIILIVLSLRPLGNFLNAVLSSRKRWGLFLLIIVGIAFTVWKVSTSNLLDKNNMLYRLTVGTNEESNSARLELVMDAFNVFIKHPFIGVGIDNYRYYSIIGAYSHNTYLELLACCGLIGAFPFIFCMVKVMSQLLSKRMRSIVHYCSDDLYRYRLIIILDLLLLYIGMMQIIFYERNLMAILGIIISFILIYNQPKYRLRCADRLQNLERSVTK